VRMQRGREEGGRDRDKINSVHAIIKTDGGQLTPSKLLDRVPVIDVIEVSCA
jgi:hypothetical protein